MRKLVLCILCICLFFFLWACEPKPGNVAADEPSNRAEVLQVEELQDLFGRTLVVPTVEIQEDGTTVHYIAIFVGGFSIPETTQGMKWPTIGGIFQEDQLDRSDLVVCDRLAKDIEASCLEIPQGSREMVINLLTKLYAYWKAQEELKLKSDEAPAMPMPLPVDPGITHPA